MTCKKFFNQKNVLARVKATPQPSYLICRGPRNTQTTRGPPRVQHEDGVEVPTNLLNRVIGAKGANIKDIMGRFKCLVKVFKKDRPTPLVHCLAWTKGDLQAALAQIRYLMNKTPEPRVTLTCSTCSEAGHHTIEEIKRHYPSLQVTVAEDFSSVTFSGTRHYVNLARNDLQWATPKPISLRVAGPKGLLIGAFGGNIGLVREHYGVSVDVRGNEAVIVGYPTAVHGAAQWYRDLIASHGPRLRW